MRGIEKTTSVVLSVIVMVALAAILIAFTLGPFKEFKILDWLVPKIPGVQGSLIPGNPIPQTPLGQVTEVPHICGTVGGSTVCISGAGEEHQPTEVACAIANSIYTDFVKYGLKDNRENISPEPDCGYAVGDWNAIYRGGCLIDAKTFILGDTVTTPPPEWIQIPYIASGKCNLCLEPTFDEVCINYNLKNRKVPEGGANNFCDGTIPVGSTAEVIKFGNAICVKDAGNSQAWRDSCDGWYCGQGQFCGLRICTISPGGCSYESDGVDDICDNDKDRIEWTAEDSSSTLVTDGDIEENSKILNKHQKYIYGLIWNTNTNEDDKRYHVYFERIPAPSTNNTWDFIGDFLSNRDNVRFNPLGEKYQEARMIVNVTVTGAPDISENNLRANIANKLGIDISKIEYASCNGLNDCLSSAPYDGEYSIDKALFYSMKEQFKTDYAIKFRLDMKIGSGGLLNNTKTYIVMIENWFNLDVYKTLSGLNAIYEFKKIDKTISIYELP